MSVAVAAALLAFTSGTLVAAETPKLPGTASGFAGIPWGSSPDRVKEALPPHGYAFAQSDDDGDLIFTRTASGVSTHLFEVFNTSQKLVKSLIDIPDSGGDPIALYASLSKSMIAKFGKPSERFANYTGSYQNVGTDAERLAALGAGEGTLAMFWMYRDGSSVYIQVTSDLSVQIAYESRFMKVRSTPGLSAGSAAEAATAAFTGPAGWQHAGSADGLGTWTRTSDADHPETIVVTAKEGIASLDALVQAERSYVNGHPDVVGPEPTDVTACGTYPAKYLTYTWTGPDGVPITTEEVLAVIGNTAYAARYNKTISQNADPAAEAALRMLCGRGR